jgi:hypothetical protein
MKLNFQLADFKKFDTLDILLLATFIVYILFQVPTPRVLVPYIDSPLGLVVLFAIAVSLFVYKNPVLGVLFIFVAYEILRRNYHNAPASQIVDSVKYMANRIPTALPKTQTEKDAQLQALNPPVSKSLEEEIIDINTPVGQSHLPTYTETSFHPVMDESDLGMSTI